MKHYTEIKGQIVEVTLIKEGANTYFVKSNYDGAEAVRVKSEVFTSITKAKKYFK